MASIDQVQNIEPLRAYTALAAQTVFAYPFAIFDEDDLKVYVDNVLQVISTDYTVDGVGEDTGGNVTFLSAMAGGEVVVIYRETAIERLTDMQQNGPWRSTTTNDEFDKLTVIAQELRRDIKRALRLPLEADVDSADIELRPLSNWLERYVFIGADGTPEPATAVDVVTLSQSLIGQTLYPQTTAESSAGVTPVNYQYEPGDIRRYGAVSGQDSTAALVAARDVQESDKTVVIFIPRGTFHIASRVQWTGSTSTQDPNSMIGANASIRGEGIYSVLKPTMTDGTACISFQHSNWVDLRDFRVDTGARVNVAGGPLNCIGIEFQQYGSRADIQNVHVWGCATGWKVKGFINRSSNLWASHCNLGFDFDTINGSHLVVSAENCVKTMALLNSSGVTFAGYQDEGILYAGSGDPVESTIDGCKNITFIAPRFEGNASASSANPRPTGYFKVGYTTACKRISFIDAHCAVGIDYYKHYLDFDNVDGVFVSGYFDSFQVHCGAYFTANCRNVEYKPTYALTGIFPVGEPTGFPTDDSKSLGPLYNYFPNSNFDLWFRGWTSVVVSAATLTKETTIVRNGPNALRITCTTAAGGFNVVQFRITGAAVTALRGKTATLAAWVWVPDLAAYDDADTTSQTARAAILLQTDGGGTDSPTQNNHTMKGHWNFINVDGVIGATATYIDVSIYANQSSTQQTTSEFVVVDSIFLVEGTSERNSDKLLNGRVIDSPHILSVAAGGKLIQRTDTTPADVDQTYEVGDRIEYITPTAGGNLGEVCTTAGAGGTAVFKTFGAIAA